MCIVLYIKHCHKKIDHKRLAFACPVQDCGRSFSVLSNMRRHSRVHHSHPVSLAESASDHCSPRLSSTSSNLAPMQSHR